MSEILFCLTLACFVFFILLCIITYPVMFVSWVYFTVCYVSVIVDL